MVDVGQQQRALGLGGGGGGTESVSRVERGGCVGGAGREKPVEGHRQGATGRGEEVEAPRTAGIEMEDWVMKTVCQGKKDAGPWGQVGAPATGAARQDAELRRPS